MSRNRSTDSNLMEALKRFRFTKKITLDVTDVKSGDTETCLQNGNSVEKSGKSKQNEDDTIGINTINRLKRKVNCILSDSEGDADDISPNPPGETNGVKFGSDDTDSISPERNDKADEETNEDKSGGMKTKFSEKKTNGEKMETTNSRGSKKISVKEESDEEKSGSEEDEENLPDDASGKESVDSEDAIESKIKNTGFKRKTSSKKASKLSNPSIECDQNGVYIIGAQTVEEKALQSLIKKFPGCDPIMMQDILLRNGWNVEAAAEILRKSERRSPSKRQEGREMNGKKRLIADSESEDSGDDARAEDSGTKFKKRKVFDSDADSDEEISNELTGDKKAVFEFFCSGKIGELQLMNRCSKKKAEIIESLRPFANWTDLVVKLETKSQLSTDLLNAAQLVLNTRKNVEELTNKCLKISQRLENAVASSLSSERKQPSLLSKHLTLSDYQLVGLNWLWIMHTQQVNAILADEMGLGKTVQIISFLARLKESSFNRPGCPHLIVVPSATLDNWCNELARWCPSLNVAVYRGSQEERKYQRIDWVRNGFGDTDVILSTYSIVGNTPEERKMFRVIKLHYAIFDEAHMLKNMASQRYDNLIGVNAISRILMTGTPLQNNLLELMSLLVFVMPKMFHGKKEALMALFSKGGRTTNVGNEDALPEFERKQISLAKEIMKPFVLRRLKNDVLKDLPTKTASVKVCPMLPDQETKYKELIANFSEQAKSLVREDEEDVRDSGMTMYMNLRKMANHPLLLRYIYGEEDIQRMAKALSGDCMYKDTKPEYIVGDLAFKSDFELHQMTKEYKSCCGWGLKKEDIVKSGKFAELDSYLPQLKSDGHRVLLFSQFVIVLDIVAEYLRIRGHKFLRLDGATPVNIRQDLIDEYNQDPSIFVFMLTTRAGGLGINLTAADTVIIHDVDSNPHNDKQAEDRAHRIGQTRPVTVIRLVSKGTIEENILQLADEKLILEKEITNEDNGATEKKSVASLLRQVLGFSKGSTSKSPFKGPSDS